MCFVCIFIIFLFSRTPQNTRAAIKIEEVKGICYIAVDDNGTSAQIIADDEYPEKTAFIIIQEMF